MHQTPITTSVPPALSTLSSPRTAREDAQPGAGLLLHLFLLLHLLCLLLLPTLLRKAGEVLPSTALASFCHEASRQGSDYLLLAASTGPCCASTPSTRGTRATQHPLRGAKVPGALGSQSRALPQPLLAGEEARGSQFCQPHFQASLERDGSSAGSRISTSAWGGLGVSRGELC